MNKLFSNLNQQPNLSSLILNKILFSKRLLIDHIESLELYLNEVQLQTKTNKNSIFNVYATTSALTTLTILCKYIVPKEKKFLKITTIALFGNLSFVYFVKSIFHYRNNRIINSLEDFIKSLENFSNSIKRNILYFNEIQTIKLNSKNDDDNIDYRQQEKIWNCIRMIKTVTEFLYNSTRQLEKSYELSMDIADIYCPMEELSDCDYFKNHITSFNAKNIKDFYNIFAYVQSQYLFRLSLLAIQNFPLHFLYNDLCFLTSRIQILIQEDEKYFKNLSLEMKNSNKIVISSLKRSIPYQQNTTNIGIEFILRNSSLKLSSCIYAVAEESQKLDNVLQHLTENLEENDTQNFIRISNSMKSIENSLSICCDDFHRLILIYNKFLNEKLKLQTENNLIEIQDETNKEEYQQITEENNEFNDDTKFDDFFAFIYDENVKEENQERSDINNEIYNIDEKLTKNKFKPVLRQLKNRIDPIRQEMLEKERKILELKGIDMNKFLNDNNNSTVSPANHDDHAMSSDSEGSYDEIEKSKMKHCNKKDVYEEMRNFLAQKEAINVFQFQLPTDNTLSEEILE